MREVVGDVAGGEVDVHVYGHEVVLGFGCGVEEVGAGGEGREDLGALIINKKIVGLDEDAVVCFEDLEGFGVGLAVGAGDGGVEGVGGWG